jgi:hypothetical protein
VAVFVRVRLDWFFPGKMISHPKSPDNHGKQQQFPAYTM